MTEKARYFDTELLYKLDDDRVLRTPATQITIPAQNVAVSIEDGIDARISPHLIAGVQIYANHKHSLCCDLVFGNRVLHDVIPHSLRFSAATEEGGHLYSLLDEELLDDSYLLNGLQTEFDIGKRNLIPLLCGATDYQSKEELLADLKRIWLSRFLSENFYIGAKLKLLKRHGSDDVNYLLKPSICFSPLFNRHLRSEILLKSLKLDSLDRIDFISSKQIR